MRFERTGAKPARGEIRPLGCRELRAPTWRDRTGFYAACPPRRAARIGALIVFIRIYLQPFACLSSNGIVISVINASRTGRSDPIFYFQLIIARMVLLEIRAGKLEAS